MSIRMHYFAGCLKPKEAAKYVGVNERTLKSWYDQGLPHIKMNDRLTLIEGDELKKFVQNRKAVKTRPTTRKGKVDELLRKTIGD